MDKLEVKRRHMLGMLAAAGMGGALPSLIGSANAASADEEYVFLSVVTQVPFWADHRAGLDAASADLGVKTNFTAPLDFDTAGQ